MSKKISIGAAITLIAIAIAITFCVTLLLATERFNNQISDLKEKEAQYTKLAEVDAIAREHSYFNIESQELNTAIVQGYLSSLNDKYARYYTEEEAESYLKTLKGMDNGLGLSLMDNSNGLYVYKVIAGSPAYEAGIKAGMIITAVNDEVYSEKGYDGLIQAADVETGTQITLTVTSAAGIEETYKVTKKEYSVQSVTSEKIDSIMYIAISGFYSDTAQQFKAVLKEVTADTSVTGIVFDVRNNTGGQLDSVVEILDTLLPEGTIVTQTNKNGEEIAKYTSDSEQISIPMTVLVNGTTASAAELFACALRDYGKAFLVGEKTYGKGCAQTTYTLSDGSILVLTTSMYNPPSSDNYDGVGLVPEFAVSMSEEQNRHLYELDEQTDPQLKEALYRLLNGGKTDEELVSAA